MSDVYAPVDIPKSLPIHGMALTSPGRKMRAQQGSGCHPNIRIDQLDFPRKVGTILSSSMCSRLVITPPFTMSDAYATVDIPKSLPIHGMALTSTGRKIEHNKVVVDTQTYESSQLDFPQKVGILSSLSV